MKESQHVEFKEIWRDEYLKSICGFANAEGGALIIGKNDKGEAVGVSKAAKLLKDLPNKIRDVLGIMVDVRLISESGKEIIEIRIDSYPSPISYKGEYHYRSGSTNQRLKGAALETFLLRKQGRSWDSVPVPYAKVDELDAEAFEHFRRAATKSGRMDTAILEDSQQHILENLNLFEGDHLRLAAVLLFHKNPGRFITGAYVKIGFFRNDADLIYQDEVHDNLFEQARRTVDLLLTKYMKAYIHYDGITMVAAHPSRFACMRINCGLPTMANFRQAGPWNTCSPTTLPSPTIHLLPEPSSALAILRLGAEALKRCAPPAMNTAQTSQLFAMNPPDS